MITDVEVEDYQAVRKASLKLGRFTVVTGPTGSGKSAVVRAMRLAAFNARGTSFVRHGAKLCQAALGFRDENMVVVITRGSRGRDAYTLRWLEGPGTSPDDMNGVQFTKLEGKVPPEVSEILSLGEVNFAGQFDRPYLLTESGGQVARTLGGLTNVAILMDAVREANRRKLETARELRTAEARLADLKEQARGFRGLKDRMEAARDARDRLDSMDLISETHGRLDAAWLRWRQASMALESAERHLRATELPSAERLGSLARQLDRLHELEALRGAAQDALAGAAESSGHWSREQEQAEETLHAALAAAGVCPVCGQAVTELWRP